MENASKALLMAGGVLIGLLIISLAVYLFVDFGSMSANVYAQKDEQRIVNFNSKYTSYENKELTIYDVITIAKYAKENNEYYKSNADYQVTVDASTANYIKAGNVQDLILEKEQLYIKNSYASITDANPNLPKYKCEVNGYNDEGRVTKVNISNW